MLEGSAAFQVGASDGKKQGVLSFRVILGSLSEVIQG